MENLVGDGLAGRDRKNIRGRPSLGLDGSHQSGPTQVRLLRSTTLVLNPGPPSLQMLIAPANLANQSASVFRHSTDPKAA